MNTKAQASRPRHATGAKPTALKQPPAADSSFPSDPDAFVDSVELVDSDALVDSVALVDSEADSEVDSSGIIFV